MHLTDEKIYEYLDNEMKADESSAVHKHILICPDCQKRLEELERLEADLVSAFPSDKEIADAKEDILEQMERGKTDDGILSFFKKTFSVSFAGLATTAAAFVMIMIGTIVALNPNSREIEKIVPAANSNISRENIYQVSNEKELSLEDHIRAIEEMGYSVVLEPIRH
ncbi:MAG TPA: hypothetical protein DCO86_00465 [Spirochaetaceae bacterium]|nr:hypothetical protein [Spirochaetaceae bacterium]